MHNLFNIVYIPKTKIVVICFHLSFVVLKKTLLVKKFAICDHYRSNSGCACRLNFIIRQYMIRNIDEQQQVDNDRFDLLHLLSKREKKKSTDNFLLHHSFSSFFAHIYIHISDDNR
jgi:hypothetical protein